MADLADGHAGVGPQAHDEEDPDSTVRGSFFSRLFRREPHDADAGAPAVGEGSKLHVNLSNLRRLRVEDVCVPRPDIVAVPDTATLPALVAAFKSSTLTRLPVYCETLDQPLGLVHLKDLALVYGFDAGESGFDLRGLLRPLLYAPPSMPIGVLLQKMQSAHIHMALVIDEYGGVDGLVTLEDLLEQVVGEIADEHDEAEEDLWSEEAPGVFNVQARMELEPFQSVAGVVLVNREVAEEVDTLGGLVVRLAGRVPTIGEVVPHPDGHEFEVLEADARRITRLRVMLAPVVAARAAE